jgi:hypothetical protein
MPVVGEGGVKILSEVILPGYFLNDVAWSSSRGRNAFTAACPTRRPSETFGTPRPLQKVPPAAPADEEPVPAWISLPHTYDTRAERGRSSSAC